MKWREEYEGKVEQGFQRQWRILKRTEYWREIIYQWNNWERKGCLARGFDIGKGLGPQFSSHMKSNKWLVWLGYGRSILRGQQLIPLCSLSFTSTVNKSSHLYLKNISGIWLRSLIPSLLYQLKLNNYNLS